MDDITEFVKRHPDARIALLNGAGFPSTPLGQANSGLRFGTGMPFHYADPALVRLEVLEADQSVKERIAGGNARQLLDRQTPKE